MDIFGKNWENHHNKIKENWISTVKENDTVILPGDLSWGMTLEEAKADLLFLDSLPGKKIIGKGNHDYWWQTKKKIDDFFSLCNIETISILYNNAYKIENKIICGTRGWINENQLSPEDEKIILRESGRLSLSLEAAKKLRENDEEIIVFLHYPPAYRNSVSVPICKHFITEKISRCYYGHLHGAEDKFLISKYGNTVLNLVSSDYLDFKPLAIN